MKDDPPFEKITIDGEDYFWRFRHGWVLDRGLKGVSISVWRVPERTRELILDFPFSVFGLHRSPKRTVLVAALPAAVRAAVAAGWQPDSRGRTFRFNLPEASPNPPE